MSMAIAAAFFVAACEPAKEEAPKSAAEFVEENMEFSATKIKAMVAETPDPAMTPRSADEQGNLVTNPTRSWTSGFFAGNIWYMYDYFGTDEWKQLAHTWTMPLEAEQTNTRTHDLGFMLYCSFGNGYRLTGNDTYKNIMIEGANSLISRFKDEVGLIRSWDHGDWQYPVIIDNMMNLEFLFWATKATGDSVYYNVAVTHADNTLKHQFRDDWSSYHVIDYDTLTGEVLGKGTHQGHGDETAWARGQAWGLYGYTMTYRETKDPKYLDAAVNIADFILNHDNLPDDKVPYWDFNAPDIPNTQRDVSAAAIISSALFELSDYVENGDNYYAAAEGILRSLGSEKYRADNAKNANFILEHSVGHKPKGSEIDVPLVYADYYFLEALLRYQEHEQ